MDSIPEPKFHTLVKFCGAGILATAREKGKGLEMTRCEILGPSVGRQERIVEEKLSVLSGDS